MLIFEFMLKTVEKMLIFQFMLKTVEKMFKGEIKMDKYLVVLAAPSLHLMSEPDNYIEPYMVEFKKGTSLDEIGHYVNEKLMRKFSLQYSVGLNDVRILAAARVK